MVDDLHSPGAEVVDQELLCELRSPLTNQERRNRNEDCAGRIVEHVLPNYETGLNGLANANVIGNQQANRGESQCHQQRHELIRARLHGDVAEAAERPATGERDR